MFGREMINFIKKNQLEDTKLFDGKDDLPGYITSKDLSCDLGVRHRVVLQWIEWGLIPDAIHIGSVWFVPCDLELVGSTHFSPDLEQQEDEQVQENAACDVDIFFRGVSYE